jgi:ABC-type oligopeptide transport system ATPase subunit
MKLTAGKLQAIYVMLTNLRPFDAWAMPPTDEIIFQVTSELDAMGTYVFDDLQEKHVLTISKAKNAHLDTVIRTMAHEMIHMKRGKTKGWNKHDRVFRNHARRIALELGFDPLEL